MNKNALKLTVSLLGIGVVSGCILAAFLGISQQLTGKKVYLLLVNVDYIPVVKAWDVGPVMGFLFHIIVSVAIVFVLYFLLKKSSQLRNTLIYILANGLGGAALFSLTALSARTPAFTDPAAFSYWVAGHVIYGATVGMMIKRNKQIREQ